MAVVKSVPHLKVSKPYCEGLKSDTLGGGGWSAWIMVGVAAGVCLLVVTLMAVAGVKCYRRYTSSQ